MVKELSEKEIKDLLAHEERMLVFFYTPLCGTCKLARRMIDIVDATLNESITIYTCDANFAPNLVQTWHVSSVPALAYLDEAQTPQLQFAFANVEDLYTKVRAFMLER